MNVEENLKKDRILILQTLAETYLKINKMPPSKTLFKNSKDEFGVINDEQAAILHLYLEDEYKKMGFNLIEAIKNSGEEYVSGKLSKYEINELIRRADELIAFFGVLNMRKNAAEKKEI